MENASKGLLIAAAVLIVILIVTMSIKILSPVEGTKEKAEEIGETMSGASESAVGKLQTTLGTSTGTQQPGKEENKTVKVGEIVKVNSTINGQPYSKDNPIIPAGFMAINTETSSWGDGTSAPEVEKGLVIKDNDGNEFVWVPVTEEIKAYGIGTTSTREPDVVTGNGTQYDTNQTNLDKAGCADQNRDGEITVDDFKMQLTNEFDAMARSVNTYKGFYVGRYETSINGVKAQSIIGATSATAASNSANTWYGLYKTQKTYITSSVRSSMIWGSQYDAMMKWMESAAGTTIGEDRNTSTERKTGIAPKDVIKNVYDLYGNSYEWTLEASSPFNRVIRGGHYGDGYSPSFRNNSDPGSTSSYNGSRLALYIV